jgi:serine/threonine protein kinase
MVQQDGALPIDRAADYITQAAIGLQHAYEQGLVHRDIKPGNLLVNRQGVVKILDMGLSRFCNAEESVLTRDVLGTLDYLAPEQAADSHTVDIRADIYSLGGTFYYLLTGQSPLNTDTLDPVAIARKANRPKPIRDLRPEVPESLVAIIDRMMASDPQKRFPNPASLANALRLWKEGVPVPPLEDDVPTVPPPPRSRPLPPIQVPSSNHQPERSRSKLPYLIVLAGCLLLAVGVGLAIWLILMAP